MIRKELIKEYAIKELNKELDKKDMQEAANFIDKELNDETLREKVKSMYEKLEEENLGEKFFLVLELMILGLGRNRICVALEKFKVDRGVVEKVRDICNLKTDPTKKENEKYITALKWKTKKRKEHKEMISDSTWFKIKSEYVSGESPLNIGKKYGVSGHIISQRLREEGVFDELRSTLTKNKIAENEISKIEDSFFIELMNENKDEPVYNIWRIAQVKYPWLLRRQFLDKLKELGIERTEDEVTSLKVEKSKVSPDNSFTIKKYIINAVSELFGSIQQLTDRYLNNELGTYEDIAKFINENNKMKINVTERQVYRLISNNANFRRTKSIEQDNLYKELVKMFPGMDIFEEVRFGENNKCVDIYIPELKIAIDYNGDYWHSDAVLKNNSNTTAFFHHKERVETLKDEGVKLIYVWSSDWTKKRDGVINALKNKEWENEMLNQYESPINSKGIISLHKELVQEQIKKLLKDAGYENSYKVDGDEMKITF